MHSHEVCQIEFRIRCTCENRTALVESGYMLAGEIVVGKESAAVCLSLQCFVVQLAKQIICVNFHAERLRKFTEKTDPRVQIRGTVLAVYHCNRTAGRRRHHIDLRVYLREIFLQNDHRKDRSSCRHVSGSDTDTVCSCHTGSGISLRRAERNACFPISGYIEKCSSFFCKNAGILPCRQNVRQNIQRFPCVCFVCDGFVKFCNPISKVSVGFGINREDSRCFSNANHALARHLPLNISGKGCHIVEIGDVGFSV